MTPRSVAKLTELAFVFIPLSCVASLFSMQVHELDGGAPLYRAILVALAFIVLAYAIRLSIRSSSLIEYQNRTFQQIREEADLQSSEPVPTRSFLAYTISGARDVVWETNKQAFSIAAPLLVILTTAGPMAIPIALLWRRKMDTGFCAIVTILLILLDAVLVYPILTNRAGNLELNLRSLIQEIQRDREINTKRRKKVRKVRSKKAALGHDPEMVLGLDGSGTDG
jgi:hypothetical protein